MITRLPLTRWLVATTLFVGALATVVPSASASPALDRQAPGVQFGPARLLGGGHGLGPLTAVRSRNWAGYVDKAHSFNYVKASWVVPRVTCTRDESLATFWVGMDGYHSKTVEQAGTMAYCHGGRASYYTWWEMYPSNKAQLVGQAVRPGDTVTASVAVSGHTYTLHVADATTKGNTFTRRATCSSCKHASVEWIAERPARQAGLFPLAKFGHLAFYSSRAGVAHTRGTISRFAHDSITMVNHSGDTMARVSTLQRGGNRFVTTWLRMQ